MDKVLALNISLCSGCGTCAVACFDHNDIDVDKQPAWRRVIQIENGSYPDVSITYVSAGCLHCHDSPCLMGCPTGAISRHGKTGAVLVDQNLCIGCRSCAMACPFGVPRYDSNDKMQKCQLCAGWVDSGREPACVRACPTGALEYQSSNRMMQEREDAFVGRLVSAARKGVAS
jgi:Fe-S-cluster-containing dehydrogenase component